MDKAVAQAEESRTMTEIEVALSRLEGVRKIERGDTNE